MYYTKYKYNNNDNYNDRHHIKSSGIPPYTISIHIPPSSNYDTVIANARVKGVTSVPLLIIFTKRHHIRVAMPHEFHHHLLKRVKINTTFENRLLVTDPLRWNTTTRLRAKAGTWKKNMTTEMTISPPTSAYKTIIIEVFGLV